MEFKKILTCFICIITVNSGVAQRKAKQKCREFVYHRSNPPHIIGGARTSQNEFPHMAALGYGSLNNPDWLCGGSLISEQYVLTAAHCTNVRDIFLQMGNLPLLSIARFISRGPVRVVRLGTRHLSSRIHEDIKVDHIIRNPHYRFPAAYNDIALLKLQRKVEFSKNILPACLNTATNISLATNDLTALGWGRMEYIGPSSDDLLQVQLTLSHARECNRSYRGSSRDKLPDGIREETQLCAGGELERDTCQGDSGGPLEYRNGRFHYIVGVTSFGKACGISRTPGVYTRVSAFVPWIESVVWP